MMRKKVAAVIRLQSGISYRRRHRRILLTTSAASGEECGGNDASEYYAGKGIHPGSFRQQARRGKTGQRCRRKRGEETTERPTPFLAQYFSTIF
jgi:hypothetical protein